MMSLRNAFVYVMPINYSIPSCQFILQFLLTTDYSYAQFHPLVYLVKLHIEMGMSDFIVTLAKTPSDVGQVDESITWASETQQTSNSQATSKDQQQNSEMGIKGASNAFEETEAPCT